MANNRYPAGGLGKGGEGLLSRFNVSLIDGQMLEDGEADFVELLCVSKRELKVLTGIVERQSGVEMLVRPVEGDLQYLRVAAETQEGR